MSETLVQRPTPVDLGVPLPRAMPNQEVINLDDWDGLIDLTSSPRLAARERRPQPAPDVIDVDAVIGDAEYAPGPSRRRPEPRQTPDFIILDSDSEEPRRLPRSTVFSPSPPPQVAHAIPPVPPVPHYPAHIRARRLPPAYTRGALRPREDPFPFEMNEEPAPRRPPAPPVRRFVREPRQIRTAGQVNFGNNMGLGGALLALNRQNELMALNEQNHRREQQERRAAIRARMINATRSFTAAGLRAPREQAEDGMFYWIRRRLDGFFHPHEDEDDDFMEAMAASAAEAEGRAPPLRYRWNMFGAEPLNGPANAPDYKREFTHPDKPQSNFTFDFEISPEPINVDKPGSSSSSPTESNTILVCAKCMDPLVVNIVGSDETMKRCKVWALRCGHMFDGKCIDSIMKPAPVVEVAEETSMAILDVKGKGKEKVTESAGLNDDDSSIVAVSSKSRGKRKAAHLDEEATDPHSVMPGTFEPEGIRARLRPRNKRTGLTESAEHTLEDDSSISGSAISPRRPGRSGGPLTSRIRAKPSPKGKGKGKAKVIAPVIEAEHEWMCPIPECSQKHYSLKIDGVWRMDEERGAIGVYV